MSGRSGRHVRVHSREDGRWGGHVCWRASGRVLRCGRWDLLSACLCLGWTYHCLPGKAHPLPRKHQWHGWGPAAMCSVGCCLFWERWWAWWYGREWAPTMPPYYSQVRTEK
eukprot:5075833-Prorocentrum_lima.AAC.1